MDAGVGGDAAWPHSTTQPSCESSENGRPTDGTGSRRCGPRSWPIANRSHHQKEGRLGSQDQVSAAAEESVKREWVDDECCLILLLTEEKKLSAVSVPGWQLGAAVLAGLSVGDKEGPRCKSAFRWPHWPGCRLKPRSPAGRRPPSVTGTRRKSDYLYQLEPTMTVNQKSFNAPVAPAQGKSL